MAKIAVIGAGRLAWNLIPALQSAGNEVFQLISRNPTRRKEFAEAFQIPSIAHNLSALSSEADFVFLTVSDKAIESVAHKITRRPDSRAIFVHSSGSIALDALSSLGHHRGVFYPMQIFTFDRPVPFHEIPIFIEGEGKVLESLEGLALGISNRVFRMNSEQRLRLHMGAVIACNFPNFLWRIVSDQLPAEVGLDVYKGLVQEAVDKAFEFGPENTQTGPAVRGDLPTLQKHLTLLKEKPQVAELYQMLSEMINPDIK